VYGAIGSWFIATPFALHLLLLVTTARHLAGSNKLATPSSRIGTSLTALYVCFSMSGLSY
jgi:hypothetical protein